MLVIFGIFLIVVLLVCIIIRVEIYINNSCEVDHIDKMIDSYNIKLNDGSLQKLLPSWYSHEILTEESNVCLKYIYKNLSAKKFTDSQIISLLCNENIYLPALYIAGDLEKNNTNFIYQVKVIYSYILNTYNGLSPIDKALSVQNKISVDSVTLNENLDTILVADELTKLVDLKNNGYLTEEEFNTQKIKILS